MKAGKIIAATSLDQTYANWSGSEYAAPMCFPPFGGAVIVSDKIVAGSTARELPPISPLAVPYLHGIESTPKDAEQPMSRLSSTRTPAPKVSPKLVATAFVAGALAVPLFHQVLFLLLYLLGVIPVAPFRLEPTAPFGVPEVVSASFWGGVWGVVFGLTLPRFFHGIGYWLASAIIGGLALTLVYMFVVVPLKTGTLPPEMGGLFIIGLLLNAAWGIGWALLWMLLDLMREQPTLAR